MKKNISILKKLIHRKKETHKGHYGHLLIVAGSRSMTGAAILCAQSALRSGAGLVTVAVPGSIHPIVAAHVIEAMTLPLPETEKGSMNENAIQQILSYIKSRKINSIVLGPGLGMDIKCRMAVLGIINHVECPGVIDADGLNQLTGNLNILKRSSAEWIMTPHPGELSRLLNKSPAAIQKDRIQCSLRAARESGAVCILKGHRSVITDGKKTVTNQTGNPGMATAGSGDVLSGIIGGFLAQGLKPFDAAQWGSFIHGLAGDCAAQERSEPALIARDIVEFISHAFKKSG